MTLPRPSRPSPSRTKQTGKVSVLLPAQIPLPPSPPASDALLLEDSLGLPSPPRARRRGSPRRNASGSHEPVRQSPRRLDTTHRALEAAIGSTQQLTRTRAKKRRVVEDPFEANSPPTSPTNSKSAPNTKRPKASSSCPSLRPLASSLSRPIRDSPNNPFLVRPGEKPRRPGAKRDDEYRKLVYVFRGKRILCEDTEDLDDSGGSPFSSSAPKLLFPSAPSPGPIRKLKFETEQKEEEKLGASGVAQGSPRRAAQAEASQLAFQTPKRNKPKIQPDCPHILPTPQSRPRRSVQSKTHPNTAHPLPLSGPVQASKSMAKAMR